MSRKLPTLALPLLLALAAGGSLRAGTITVGNLPATGTDAATGISTTKNYLCCIDFGNNSSPPGNINGVPFVHPDLGNQTVNSYTNTDPNFGGSYIITTGGSAPCKIARTTSSTPAGQADGNTWEMLNDMVYVGSAAPTNSWMNQTYGGLTAGHNYALRIYYRQWAADTRSINISFNGEGTSQPFSGNPLNEDAGGAHYIEYDFTAATTNVFVGMTNLIANESPMVYGVTLEDSTHTTGIKVVNLPATNTDAATGLNPSNTYICCIDFGNSSSPPGNINGVPFIHPNLGNQVVNTTNGLDTNHGGNYTISTGGSAPCQIAQTTSSSPTGQADGNTWAMLNDMIYVGSAAPANSWMNQTYGGLIAGHPYALRIYYRQWAADTRTVNISFNGQGTNELFAGNPLNEDSGGAHYIEYDFTAATTNVSIGMTNLLANESPLVYGVTLQDNSPPYAPVMTQQPAAAVSGSALVFTATAVGAPSLAYQWYSSATSNYNGAVALTDNNGVSGSRTCSLTTSSNLQNYYFVIVTNNYGAVTSAIASFSALPAITQQPMGGTNAPGAFFDLSVAANGVPPLAFQWYKNGSALVGATHTGLGFGYLRASDSGSYDVVVTNAFGAVTSSVVPLVIAGAVAGPPDFTEADSALVAAAAQAAALASSSDTNQATTNWTAHWIGPAGSTSNLWLCYRKTFSLPTQPASAIARIAVDSKYWLWVNGQIAVREGELKREPNSNDSWYDEIDLAPLLQPGSNTIAVLQWYFGITGFSHLSSGTAGFLFEMNADGTSVLSDTSWRMVTNAAFQLATVVPQPNSRISESSLRYDMRLDLGAWTNGSFNDSAWGTPTDRGPVGGPPWGRLWLRDIPFWQELPLQDFASASVSGTNPAVWTCYLPVNEQFTPWLDVSNASGGQIITIVPDSVAVTASPAAEYVTTAGRQSFEFPGWLSGNLVQFTVPASVTVYGLEFRPHLADTQREGSFTCDNSFFNTLWTKAANTVGVNMQDTWGESRERANWIGDTSLILGQAPYAYDPMVELLSRKCLLDLVHWQRADQTMFAPAPANYKELPVQVLAAVGEYGVMRYYRNTGDTALLLQCYPAIKSYLLNVWQTNSNGLVIHRDGQWDWEDWGDNIDEPLLDNAWYLLALDAAAEMAPLVGQPADAASYLSRAQGIRNQFNSSFWTGYGYRSPTNTTFTDERGNAMAVLAGLTSPSQAPVLEGVLITNQNCSPYMEKYVLEALFKLGYTDDALARMQSRYSAMVSNSSTTLWELFPATGGFNHGWSSGPISLLDEDVTGVAATSPEWATFEVRPALGATLNFANASVPSPYGIISVAAARDGTNYRLSVRVPPGSSGQAFQPNGGGLLSGAALSIEGGATAVMDDTASPSDIDVTNGSATLITNMNIDGTIEKSGSGTFYIAASSPLSSAGFEAAAGETAVSAGGQLTATNIAVCPSAILDNQGGIITCCSLTNLGIVECSGGSLTIECGATNQGTLRLLGNSQLNVSGPLNNSGILDIITWTGTLPTNLVNNGVILDRNAINIQSYQFDGSNFTVTIMGYTGHAYQLQYANTLAPPLWMNLGAAQPGNGTSLNFVQTNAIVPNQRFFRIVVDPD